MDRLWNSRLARSRSPLVGRFSFDVPGSSKCPVLLSAGRQLLNRGASGSYFSNSSFGMELSFRPKVATELPSIPYPAIQIKTHRLAQPGSEKGTFHFFNPALQLRHRRQGPRLISSSRHPHGSSEPWRLPEVRGRSRAAGACVQPVPPLSNWPQNRDHRCASTQAAFLLKRVFGRRPLG